MDNKLLIGGVAVLAAVISYATNSGPRPGSPDKSAGASAPPARPRMLTDVRACTVDTARDAITGVLVNGNCTVLRAGEEIEVQFFFSENPNARDDRDLERCVRPKSWPREPGVYDPRESRDCVVISRDDYAEARR
jgi:hypothetical protein